MSYRQSSTMFRSNDLFRESKGVSPGRLHKTRESFGPTLCLINNKNQSPPPQLDSSEDKMKILLLSLQIQRLNNLVAQISAQKSIRYSEVQTFDQQYTQKQIKNLKIQLQTSQQTRYQQIQRLNQIIYANNNKMAEYETQIKILNRRNQEANDNTHDMRRTLRQLQEQVSRAKAQASRANFNALLNSQSELQRSKMRETNNDMDRWKQKLTINERKIDQQKITIISQRQTIDRLKNSELQIRQRMQYDLTNLKTQNQQLKDKLIKLKKQMSEQTMNSQQNFRKQLMNKQIEIQRLNLKRQQAQKRLEVQCDELQNLRRNTNSHETNSRMQISELKNTIDKLQKQLEQSIQNLGAYKKKQDKYRKQITYLKKQIDILKNEIQRKSNQIDVQVHELKQDIEKKDNLIRKLKKSKNKQQDVYSSSRFNKSYSQSNLHLKNNVLRNSQNDLKAIIADVVDLQHSNQRIARIIENNKNSTINNIKMVSYSSYGL